MNNIEKRLNKVLKSALLNLGIRNALADIFLLKETELRQLKRKFFHKKTSKTPDVLAFAEPKGFPHPERSKRFLGEIYLNRDLENESPGRLVFFLIHGLLHLMGCAHDKKNDTVKMEALERKLMKNIFSD